MCVHSKWVSIHSKGARVYRHSFWMYAHSKSIVVTRNRRVLNMCINGPNSQYTWKFDECMARMFILTHSLSVLPPFHSTCPGEFFLRVLIWCLFSHFSVQSSILCTSWQGRRILFRSFFAVSKCHIQPSVISIKIRACMLAAIKAVSDTHETCELWPLWYHIKKLFPICQLWDHQGPLNHCASHDVTREFSPRTALRNNCPSSCMVIRIHARALHTENWRMSWFFVSNSKMKIKTKTPGFDVIQLL